MNNDIIRGFLQAVQFELELLNTFSFVIFGFYGMRIFTYQEISRFHRIARMSAAALLGLLKMS